MIQSSRTASALPLHPLMIRRRRPLMIGPPAGMAIALPVPDAGELEGRSGWQDDLRFFLACYAAGLVFFLVMLS